MKIGDIVKFRDTAMLHVRNKVFLVLRDDVDGERRTSINYYGIHLIYYPDIPPIFDLNYPSTTLSETLIWSDWQLEEYDIMETRQIKITVEEINP